MHVAPGKYVIFSDWVAKIFLLNHQILRPYTRIWFD